MRKSATTAYMPVLLGALLPSRCYIGGQQEDYLMGMTMTQKILAKHAHRDSVSAGDLLVSLRRFSIS